MKCVQSLVAIMQGKAVVLVMDTSMFISPVF